jgi:hypothetical protein
MYFQPAEQIRLLEAHKGRIVGQFGMEQTTKDRTEGDDLLAEVYDFVA